MGALMERVGGDAREILLAITVEDWAGFDDRARFDAHLSLGGGLDPTWLDLFSESVRKITGKDGPADFIDARRELDAAGEEVDRVIERVDPAWIDAIARLADHHIHPIARHRLHLLP